MVKDFLKELQSFLKKEQKRPSVVVMPDFFLDRFVSPNCNLNTFHHNLETIARQKGGSIDKIDQMEIRGGNAVNTASALAALGAKVTPIVCTNALGLNLIKFYLGSFKIDFSHVKILERPSITTALEFETESGKANVMLRDVGSLADFEPRNLDDKDYAVMEHADCVCVFNWAGTKRFGTQLAEIVFRHVKTSGKGKTYCDTADPSPNKTKIPMLVKNALQSRYLDVLSINENEAVCYASHLCSEIGKLGKRLSFEELAMESARVLASELSARIDLHTTSFSATFSRKGETVVPAFEVPVLRATGAGDAWNAGNIMGDANRFSDDSRLALANAVAAYYISDPKGAHPTRKQLAQFCEKSGKL